MKKDFNIIISGVGGQGLITLVRILAEAAFLEGKDVKTSELHGLSQREGSVEAHVRIGEDIFSPLISSGQADFILGTEMTEGLRVLGYASKDAKILINKSFVSFSDDITEDMIEKRVSSYLVPASDICKKELNSGVVSGSYLLGYAVQKGMIPIKKESLLSAISSIIPSKYLELNKKAFNFGLHG